MDRVEEIRKQLNNTPILGKEDTQFLLSIIDQLREENEKLKENLAQQETLKEVKERVSQSFLKMERNNLQSHNNQLMASQKALLEAVEPILKILSTIDNQRGIYGTSYICFSQIESDLRHLKEVAEKIREGK